MKCIFPVIFSIVRTWIWDLCVLWMITCFLTHFIVYIITFAPSYSITFQEIFDGILFAMKKLFPVFKNLSHLILFCDIWNKQKHDAIEKLKISLSKKSLQHGGRCVWYNDRYFLCITRIELNVECWWLSHHKHIKSRDMKWKEGDEKKTRKTKNKSQNWNKMIINFHFSFSFLCFFAFIHHSVFYINLNGFHPLIFLSILFAFSFHRKIILSSPLGFIPQNCFRG